MKEYQFKTKEEMSEWVTNYVRKYAEQGGTPAQMHIDHGLLIVKVQEK